MFAAPLALLSLISIPVLLGIYWLRGKSRRHVVSSHIFFQSISTRAPSSKKWYADRLPPSFWLEALVLALLSLALANPLFGEAQKMRVCLVLDQSFSMLAGSPSALESAKSELVRLMDEEIDVQRVFFAGSNLTSHVPDQQRTWINAWDGMDNHANLAEAIQSALDVGLPVHVMTDHAAKGPLAPEVMWHAFGTPAENVGIVAVHRSPHPDEPTLIQIGNFSIHPNAITLKINDQRVVVELATRELKTIPVTVESDGLLRLELDDDALAIDNQVWVASSARAPVRVLLTEDREDLNRALSDALDHHPDVVLVTENPELVFGDPYENQWHVQFVAADQILKGPYLSDKRHPLLEGTSWSDFVGCFAELPGRPLVWQGQLSLVTVLEGTSSKSIYVGYGDHSNLLRHSNFPIMIWNLVRWRMNARDQPRHSHTNLGSTLRIPLAPTALLTDPAGRVQELHEGVFAPRMVGLWTLVAGESRWDLTVAASSADESNLLSAVTGTWGEIAVEKSPSKWRGPLLLVALAVLLGYGWLLAMGRLR
ncbi:MAG: BatA domain-containing protein [Acidobacteria bacterium]|nr:BatA domain-containing protein [Acidobacteriota bacterium]